MATLLGPVTLGNIFRGNTIQITTPAPAYNGSIQDDFYELGSIGGIFSLGNITAPFPYHESNVFEGNTGSGTRHGVWAGDFSDAFFNGNTLSVTDPNSSMQNPVYLRGPQRLSWGPIPTVGAARLM